LGSRQQEHCNQLGHNGSARRRNQQIGDMSESFGISQICGF